MVRIVPFRDEHVTAAAQLLARRHATHREQEPLLPDVRDFEDRIRQELDEATGSAALEGDEVVGYLLGTRREDPAGPHVWSGLAGHATDEPDLVRDLYAHAATRWVADGLTRHYVFAPAIRELVEPWHRLCFGTSAALALRATADPVPGTAAEAVTLRRSTPDDLPAVARLGGIIESTLVEAPSFSDVIRQQTQDELEADWADTWSQDDYVHFVAELGGRVVGHTLLHHRPPDLRFPPASIYLSIAATDPLVRGGGVGVAMTAHVLGWAREQGLAIMTTDWRMTNLSASRFWPRRGFHEAYFRLYRSIP